MRSGATPSQPATTIANSALVAWCSPLTPSRVVTGPQGVLATIDARRSSSSVHRVRRTSTPGPLPHRSTGATPRADEPRSRGIVTVDDRDTGSRQRFEQLALDRDDALGPAEVLRVREPDVGDDADLGTRDRAQLRDVAGEARAHLGDEDLREIVGGQHRERKSDLVVERLGVRVHDRVRRRPRPR